MHCLPFQAKTDNINLNTDHCDYLGPGDFHHVSLWSHAASHQGTVHPSVPRGWQQDQPFLLVQGKLAQPRDAQDLHHRSLRQHLPCSPFSDSNHVRSYRHHAFQNSGAYWRETRPRKPPGGVQEETEGD